MAMSCYVSPHLQIQHLSQQHHHQHRINNLLVQQQHQQHKFPTSQNLIFPTQYNRCRLFAFPLRRPNFTLNALHSDPSNPEEVGTNQAYQEWDSLTSKFSGAANLPFLLLQMPQILLNARNLLAGNNTALFAIPWLHESFCQGVEQYYIEAHCYGSQHNWSHEPENMNKLIVGMLTSLLGNLSLLSYFAKKREKEAMVVQTLGVISTYVVIVQLALAESMPLPYFLATSAVVVSGLFLNFMNYFGLLNAGIWRFWEDFITIGGLSVLPQIMWSTFVPYLPNSILPGAISFVIAVLAVTMARTGKLSEKGVKFVGGISGWTATLLFMWMPVSQMWTNFLNPENMKGLSAFSMLLAMLGNGLMLPRALFIRDFMWFTGSTWATIFYGYGNLACLFLLNIISKEFFLAATVGLLSWIGTAFWRDSVVRGYSSPLASLRDLIFGS
ncbi:maltose excess protein chloroplastic-like [Trifolium pratense]|uniref:Maltose excess protein chloroplastic-like n=1 Tax=Trifolium pratense TaxID=57577 RepID=A0A2K3MUF6_TRIPR|nr:maltose excess protein chloroplastic-like [Trifolium pratense]